MLITKDVTSLKILDTDTIEIMYKIDVTNSSGAPVLYTLTDTFDFDQAITVARSVGSRPTRPSVGLAAGFNRGFNGDDSDVIAALVTIEPNNMHTYTVTVTVDVDLAAAGGPDGDCVGTATGLKNDATVTFGNRTLTDSACRPFSTLELHKTVINDDGGEAEVEDFELSAVGAVSLIGTHGVRRIVPAGDYALSETGPAGYTASDWSCTGGNVTAASVTIVDPANVVCEIVNNDVPVDLELTKSDGGAVATAGGAPFQYTITVTNVGGRDVELDEPVTVTDDLPAELVWVEPAPAGCTVAGQTLTCDVDPALLTVGAQPIEIVATVRVLPGVTATSVVNRAWVTTDDDPVCSREPCTPAACPTPDGVTANADPTNNVDCEETPIVRDARIEIIKTDSVGDGMSVRPGDVFTYQLVVRNLGPSDLLPGVRVDDDLPAQLTLVSATSTDADWTCNAVDPVVCTYASALGAGETAPSIVVTVRVAAAASGTSIRNVATARGEAGPNCPTPGAGELRRHRRRRRDHAALSRRRPGHHQVDPDRTGGTELAGAVGLEDRQQRPRRCRQRDHQRHHPGAVDRDRRDVHRLQLHPQRQRRAMHRRQLGGGSERYRPHRYGGAGRDGGRHDPQRRQRHVRHARPELVEQHRRRRRDGRDSGVAPRGRSAVAAADTAGSAAVAAHGQQHHTATAASRTGMLLIGGLALVASRRRSTGGKATG